MAKKKNTVWVCQSCGTVTYKWSGYCASCGEWNTIVEETVRSEAPARGIGAEMGMGQKPVSINKVDFRDTPRFKSGSSELDRVLGGGIVPGSLVLVGGDPGIGKSTLLTQLAHHIGSTRGTVLYVTAEESAQQVRLRAERLKALDESFLVVAEADMQAIEEYARSLKPVLLIIDSIQTVYKPEIPSAPGSVVQVRECAAQLLRFAKNTGTPVFIVGHVTKEGAIAGPRVLEHMVDTVLYFEGERHTQLRILQAVKNRFGALEIGVYEIAQEGLLDVPNASMLFLSERPVGASGSVVVPVMEGTRPLLVEVQALVGSSPYQYARRTTTGIDVNRLQLLIAVLEKRAGLLMGSNDAYVKVTGGVRIDEPAVDLGLAVALASSFKDVPVDPATIVIGEVGLAGEVRSVSNIEQRIKEAQKLGFKRAVVPKSALSVYNEKGFILLGVSSLSEALEAALRR
ncbi:MAG TPA: DNA repair protein RadA [Candidatus Atribacteria bacterium]|nr:DNA repair protein RadA [Candidatus Atribacteria bacterium]HPT78407.1 DNA repair protein RadA [Candidatus Atribacteria bacterium]